MTASDPGSPPIPAAASRRWAPGAATGVGSLPGADPIEALRVVFGELPDLPHLPELPERGAGADLVGRTAALLPELHVDLQPAGWRLVPRGGRDERRARALLGRDLDALEEVGGEYAGPVKVQAAGPWTLAATLELPRGGKVLGDAGAVRDVAAALREGLLGDLAELRRRVPAAWWVLQLDEPALPAVLAGTVPTASGFGALAAVEPQVATDVLGSVLGAALDAAVPAVHCCAERPPLGLLAAAGARAVSVDATRLSDRDDDAVGALVEADIGLLLGVVPSRDAELSDPSATVRPVWNLWQRLGLPAERLQAVALTPTCGLAGASPAYAREALARCRTAGRLLVEEAP